MKPLRNRIRRNWRTIYAGSATLIDAFIILTSFLVAALFHSSHTSYSSTLESHLNLGVFSIFLFPSIAAALGVYRTVSQASMKHQYLAAGKAYAYGLAIVLVVLLLLQNTFCTREFLLPFFLAIPATYVSMWSLLRPVSRELRKRGFGQWKTLLIDSGPQTNRLLKRLRNVPELGYDVVSTIPAQMDPQEQRFLQVSREEVENAINTNNIELIVLSTADLNGSYDALEDLCRRHSVRMKVVSPESDLLFNTTTIRDIAGLPLFSPEREQIESLKRILKRGFDIAGALVLLLITAPIFLLVAAAIKIESRGSVLFTQKRSLSDTDEPFEFYKFRSMHKQAEEIRESLLPFNESTGALFKIKDDPRLTRVGRFIRRFSIDEIPQLINVLKGEMSLVGPRPLPVHDFARLKENEHLGGYYRLRSKAKPGMTGLWQISGRSELGFQEMVLLDLYYIEHQTILFDIEILAHTIPVVLFGKGAY